METTNLEAFKSLKIRPTKDGLKDSKRTGEDCTLFLGITNPYSYDLKEYLGYDITKFRDSFRVLEVVLSRKGKANGLCPLFFNGSVNEYQELPRPDDKLSLEKVYRYLDDIRGVKKTKTFLMKLFRRNG